MRRIRASIGLLACLALALGCGGPSPSSEPPGTASTGPSATIPVTPGTGTTASPSPSGVGPSPSASVPVTNEIRNHLLSTLEYVGEVSDDLALASTPAAAANALRPLGGVLDDEIDWFAAHVPSGTSGPVGAYGTDIATTRAAVAAVESAGSAVSADLVATARAQVAALLALRSGLEALPSS